MMIFFSPLKGQKIFLMCAQITSFLSLSIYTRWNLPPSNLPFFNSRLSNPFLSQPIYFTVQNFFSSLSLSLGRHRSIKHSIFLYCVYTSLCCSCLHTASFSRIGCVVHRCALAANITVEHHDGREWVVHHRVCSTSSLNFFLPSPPHLLLHTLYPCF